MIVLHILWRIIYWTFYILWKVICGIGVLAFYVTLITIIFFWLGPIRKTKCD